MILGFSTQLNGKPTYFPEKIVTGLEHNKIITFDEAEYLFGSNIISKNGLCYRIKLDGTIDYKPKLHTIREDKNNRWKEGTKIDFFINCRQPTMFRFAPVLPVVSVQKIEVIEMSWVRDEFCYQKENGKLFVIKIDNAFLPKKQLENLAQNDGFDTVADFFEYFSEDFKGKIIHWTDLKY
jgi:hypothetical protein